MTFPRTVKNRQACSANNTSTFFGNSYSDNGNLKILAPQLSACINVPICGANDGLA